MVASKEAEWAAEWAACQAAVQVETRAAATEMKTSDWAAVVAVAALASVSAEGAAARSQVETRTELQVA